MACGPPTLRSWIYRARQQRVASPFLPVQVIAPSSSSPMPIEVELPSGVRLRVAPGTDLAFVVSLARALS